MSKTVTSKNAELVMSLNISINFFFQMVGSKEVAKSITAVPWVH